MKWKTKDGREVDIDKMADDHLLNAFAFARRSFREKTRINWFPGITGMPATGRFLDIKLQELYRECINRGLPWSDETVQERDRGAGDSTGLLDGLVVSATNARNRNNEVVERKEAVTRKGFLSIDLGEDDG